MQKKCRILSLVLFCCKEITRRSPEYEGERERVKHKTKKDFARDEKKYVDGGGTWGVGGGWWVCRCVYVCVFMNIIMFNDKGILYNNKLQQHSFPFDWLFLFHLFFFFFIVVSLIWCLFDVILWT